MSRILARLSTELDELVTALPAADAEARLALLADFVRRGRSEPEERVLALCERFEAAPELALTIREALCSVLCGKRLVPALTEAGISAEHGFFDELGARVGHKLLPTIRDPAELSTVIGRVFNQPHDVELVVRIPDAVWLRLFEVLALDARGVLCDELVASIRILAVRVAALGLAPELTERMPELDELDSPFLELADDMHCLLRRLGVRDPGASAEPVVVEAQPRPEMRSDCDELAHVQGCLARCRAAVDRLRAEKHRYGTSLRLTMLSFRLLQQIERLQLLLRMTAPLMRQSNGAAGSTPCDASASDFGLALCTLLRTLVRAEHRRNSVVEHFRDNAGLFAFQIVEHAAQRGSKYITSTRSEYFAFFRASLWGGVIVALFAGLKLVFDSFDLSLAGKALLFGFNYVAAFVLIQGTGGALATKQPAMTANAIARSMDAKDGGHQLEPLAELIVRTWRSSSPSSATSAQPSHWRRSRPGSISRRAVRVS